MTTKYERLTTKLGMTQQGAARFFGISMRQSRRYVSGEEPNVPDAIMMLLSLMVERKIEPDLVRQIAKLPAVVVGDARMKAEVD
jgi:hypothetical protein